MRGNPNFVIEIKLKMKKTYSYIALILIVITSFSCKEKGFPKPDKLISEKKMANMLYDIHLNEAYSNQYHFEGDIKKIASKDLYLSVLNKYGVPDSVFAQSVVFYSSMPKIYERIYQQVVDRLNMVQEENNKKKEVNIQPKE